MWVWVEGRLEDPAGAGVGGWTWGMREGGGKAVSLHLEWGTGSALMWERQGGSVGRVQGPALGERRGGVGGTEGQAPGQRKEGGAHAPGPQVPSSPAQHPVSRSPPGDSEGARRLSLLAGSARPNLR